MAEDDKSEFGKGLVICLVKFAGHFIDNNLREARVISRFLTESKEDQEKVLSGNPPPTLNFGTNFTEAFQRFMRIHGEIHKGDTESALSHQITLWANAASDHLYDIEVPKKWKRRKIRKKVEELQALGLDMGHGAGLMMDKIYTIEDVDTLMKLTIEIALLVDKELGLEAEEGQW